MPLLLWEEYRAAYPSGFGYTWFCTHFDAWKGRVRPTMRQTHVGGEKVFVDFAGDTIDVIDPESGEVQPMKLFVAAMGASNYTYAEAVASEGLEDWIGAHVRLMFNSPMWITPLPPPLKASGKGSHGSVLGENQHLVLYRVMRMRLKAKGHSASPRSALSLLARIQKHTAHAGKRSFHGLSKTTPEQLDLFDALSLPKPA